MHVFSRGGRRNPPEGIYFNTGDPGHGGSALAGGCAGGPGARDVRGGDGAAARAAARARVPHAARPREEPAGLLLLSVLLVSVRPRPCASACPTLSYKEPAGSLLLRILPAPARPRPRARQAAPARRARAACPVCALRRALCSRVTCVLCRAACAQGTDSSGPARALARMFSAVRALALGEDLRSDPVSTALGLGLAAFTRGHLAISGQLLSQARPA